MRRTGLAPTLTVHTFVQCWSWACKSRTRAVQIGAGRNPLCSGAGALQSVHGQCSIMERASVLLASLQFSTRLPGDNTCRAFVPRQPSTVDVCGTVPCAWMPFGASSLVHLSKQRCSISSRSGSCARARSTTHTAIAASPMRAHMCSPISHSCCGPRTLLLHLCHAAYCHPLRVY